MAGLFSSGLTKVAGNFAAAAIGNIGTSKKIPAFADVEFGLGSKGRNKTENLAYPLGVESDPQQGHYIIFEIMQQNKAKLAGQKAAQGVVDKTKQLARELNTKKANQAIQGIDTMGQETGLTAAGHARAAASNAGEGYKAGSKMPTGPKSLQVAQDATVAMPVCIALYMPPSVQVSYGANYGETEIGMVSESINAGLKAFMDAGGGVKGMGAAVGAGTRGGSIGGILTKVGTKIAGELPGMGGIEAVFAINRGSVITPRMELMFEGIQRRDFSFNFTFIPKSEQEADTVEKIVHKFKYHMASNYGNNGLGGVDGVREIEIPDFFNIRYMHQNAINPHLNLIKQCVLTKTDVEYGADKYKAYADGRPQTTKMSLSFQELEIITKDYIGKGY